MYVSTGKLKTQKYQSNTSTLLYHITITDKEGHHLPTSAHIFGTLHRYWWQTPNIKDFALNTLPPFSTTTTSSKQGTYIYTTKKYQRPLFMKASKAIE